MDAGLLRRVRQPPLAGAVPAPTEVAVDEIPAPPLAMGPICLEEDRENDRAAMAQGYRPPSAIRGRIEGSPSSTQAKSRIHCRACTDSLCRRASGDRRPFYVRGVPEKGLASRTSDPLSSVPQVAQATAAAGNRSLPSAVRGGGRRGLANPLRPRRAGPSGPRTEGPCGSLVGPPHPFLRDLNGSVGTDPNRKRTGTQE